MLELLRDPVWQFAGAVLAAVAILVSIAVFRAQRQQKRMSYQVLIDLPLLSLKEEAIGDLQLLFRGQPIKKTRVQFIKITNAGNAPITVADYHLPLSLDFGEGAEVLAAEVTEAIPKDLPISFEGQKHLVVFSPTLLNPRDSFVARVLVSNCSRPVLASGRIAGVSKIEPTMDRIWIVPTLSALFLLTMLYSFFYSPRPRSVGLGDIRAEEIPYIVVPMLLVVLTIFFSVKDASSRLRSRLRNNSLNKSR